MLSKLAYHLIVFPLSHLPLGVLYIMTDLLFLAMITVAPYRKKVIEGNIQRSFPSLSKKDRGRIKRRFYRHFTNLLAEGVKSLSISPAALKKRVQVENPEIMLQLFEQKKNVVLVSGHYNNWEWMVCGQPLFFPHKAIGIGMPMTSKFWDKKINERRSRFGMHVVHAKNFKEELENYKNVPFALLVLSDQSPGNSLKSYWMEFLHQPTAVLFGAELMAHELDAAVVYYTMRRKKRGFYSIELQAITTTPKALEWGEITEQHTRILEREIRKAPEFWLWSHKRWKRELPEDFEALKNQQRKKFNEKFHR